MSLPPTFVSWHLRLSVYKLVRNALFIEHVGHLRFWEKTYFPVEANNDPSHDRDNAVVIPEWLTNLSSFGHWSSLAAQLLVGC